MLYNLDDLQGFTACREKVKHEDTRNFLVEFDNDSANCALDLELNDIRTRMEAPRGHAPKTRWINFWMPDQQSEAVKEVATYYGVSSRLQGMMCSKPVPNRPLPVDAGISRSHSSPPVVATRNFDLSRVGFGNIVDDIWHFSSVDFGPKYTCIGYNSLHTVPGVDPSTDENMPKGKRVWSWLILCHDGTIISIHENPFPCSKGLSRDEKKYVSTIRRNLEIIFAHVSKIGHAGLKENPLMTIQVRQFGGGPNAVPFVSEDAASLVFYYMFDDWFTNYGIVTRKVYPYGKPLDEFRKEMTEQPRVNLIDELHIIGRRLKVLRRIYTSYELIISRLLYRQRQLADESRDRNQRPSSSSYALNLHVDINDHQDHDADRSELLRESRLLSGMSEDSNQGVRLSTAAIVRFERLLDRIRLYALTEIDECLNEKETLVFLNFNLITLKESQAVEKLTRITILLAKATILFLPVSLMTAYFSTQIRGMENRYGFATYWIAFVVIMALSVIVLIVFGFASDTVEGKTIYVSLAKLLFRKSKVVLGGSGFSRRKEQ